jgi:hypothetical protein
MCLSHLRLTVKIKGIHHGTHYHRHYRLLAARKPCNKYQIPVIPQVINFGNESYLEGVDMDTAVFMERLKSARLSCPRPLHRRQSCLSKNSKSSSRWVNQSCASTLQQRSAGQYALHK